MIHSSIIKVKNKARNIMKLSNVFEELHEDHTFREATERLIR
jgi:hypothetical protein